MGYANSGVGYEPGVSRVCGSVRLAPLPPRLRRPSRTLSRLADLMLCRSIQLFMLLARSDAARALEAELPRLA
jgi:hypothetical protein